jgi:hypothetical protein
MGKKELLAEIRRLPVEERRILIAEAIDELPGSSLDPDMTPELREELRRREQDAIDRPQDEMSWEEACAELDRRKAARKSSVQ